MRVVLLIAVVGAAASLAAPAWGVLDPKDPQQRHTAADTRLATSIALKRADLAAGWHAATPGKPPPCSTEPDESSLVQTAKIDPTFVGQDGFTKLGSEVDVFSTQAMAHKDWALSTLELTAHCLLEAARVGLPKGVHVAIASSQALAPPGGADRSLHYRIVLTIETTQKVEAVDDVVALGHGRITVVLHALTLNMPLPAADLKALTGRLADRLDPGRTGI